MRTNQDLVVSFVLALVFGLAGCVSEPAKTSAPSLVQITPTVPHMDPFSKDPRGPNTTIPSYGFDPIDWEEQKRSRSGDDLAPFSVGWLDSETLVVFSEKIAEAQWFSMSVRTRGHPEPSCQFHAFLMGVTEANDVGVLKEAHFRTCETEDYCRGFSAMTVVEGRASEKYYLRHADHEGKKPSNKWTKDCLLGKRGSIAHFYEVPKDYRKIHPKITNLVIRIAWFSNEVDTNSLTQKWVQIPVPSYKPPEAPR